MFLYDFDDLADLISQFWPEYAGSKYKGELDECEILLASYMIEGYEGSAYVLYQKDGKLYEVFASHCSCMGLEGQWEPEETSVKAISLRLAADSYYHRGHEVELAGVLAGLSASNSGKVN